jgi:hypothetical protein
VLITILNSIYYGINYNSTLREFHSNQYDQENSFIIKKFIFEFFSYYLDLFFIAFVNFEVKELKYSLFYLYPAETVRRVISKLLIPLIQRYMQKIKKSYENNTISTKERVAKFYLK